MTAVECVECAREWAHCHGTWVVHRAGDGRAPAADDECSAGPECTTPAEAHPHVVDCEEVRPGCCR